MFKLNIHAALAPLGGQNPVFTTGVCDGPALSAASSNHYTRDAGAASCATGAAANSILTRAAAPRSGGLSNEELPARAPPNSGRPLIFQNFADATAGLHPKEAADLQELYDNYQVIDLEKSGLCEIDSWFQEVSSRLTSVIEDMGEYYPQYRISLILSDDDKNSFVYKARLPGQRFYRGHVFITTAFIKKMMETLVLDKEESGGKSGKIDVRSVSREDIEVLMSGLQGIVAHEYAHPKQDEMIKWEIRESRDGLWQSHGQMDEAATDFIAQRILKKAQLDASNMLLGLMLLFGHKPQSMGYLERGARALISSHPQDSLRLNLNKGALVQLRREEGKSPIKAIGFDAIRMREEMLFAMSQGEAASRAARIMAAALDTKQSPVVMCLNEIQSDVLKTTETFDDSRSNGLERHVSWFPVLRIIMDQRPKLTEEDEENINAFFEDMLENAGARLGSNVWSAPGQGPTCFTPQTCSPWLVRKAQRSYRDHPIFKTEGLQSWIKERQKEDFWDFAAGDTPGSLHLLPALFPREFVIPIYQRAIERLKDRNPQIQAIYLMEMLHGCALMGGDTFRIEMQLLQKIHEFHGRAYPPKGKGRQDYKEAYGVIAFNFPNLLPCSRTSNANLLPYNLDRFLIPLEQRTQLAKAWERVFGDLATHPDLIFADINLAELIFMQKNSLFWSVQQWANHPEDFQRPFSKRHLTTNAPIKTAEMYEKFMGMARSPKWRAHFRGVFEKLGGNQLEGQSGITLDFMISSLETSSTDLAFTGKERLQALDEILSIANDADPDSDVFRGRIRFELMFLSRLTGKDDSILAARIAGLAEYAEAKTGMGLMDYLEKLYGSEAQVLAGAFADGDMLVKSLKALYDSGRLNEEGFERALDRYLFDIDLSKEKRGLPLASLRSRSAHILWNRYRPDGDPQKIFSLLEKVAQSMRIDNSAYMDKNTRALASAGISTRPDYAKFLQEIRFGLAADLRNLIGTGKKTAIADEAYKSAFLR